MLPLSITGLILSSFKFLSILKKNRKTNFLFFITILYLIYNFIVFNKFKGFLYNGIENNIESICLFITFSLIPFEEIKNIKIQFLIRTISSYTGGIYYFHQILVEIIRTKIAKVSINPIYAPIYACFLIYIFGYLICLLGAKVFKNNKLKLVNFFFKFAVISKHFFPEKKHNIIN